MVDNIPLVLKRGHGRCSLSARGVWQFVPLAAFNLDFGSDMHQQGFRHESMIDQILHSRVEMAFGWQRKQSTEWCQSRSTDHLELIFNHPKQPLAVSSQENWSLGGSTTPISPGNLRLCEQWACRPFACVPPCRSWQPGTRRAAVVQRAEAASRLLPTDNLRRYMLSPASLNPVQKACLSFLKHPWK